MTYLLSLMLVNNIWTEPSCTLCQIWICGNFGEYTMIGGDSILDMYHVWCKNWMRVLMEAISKSYNFF